MGGNSSKNNNTTNPKKESVLLVVSPVIDISYGADDKSQPGSHKKFQIEKDKQVLPEIKISTKLAGQNELQDSLLYYMGKQYNSSESEVTWTLFPSSGILRAYHKTLVLTLNDLAAEQRKNPENYSIPMLNSSEFKRLWNTKLKIAQQEAATIEKEKWVEKWKSARNHFNIKAPSQAEHLKLSIPTLTAALDNKEAKKVLDSTEAKCVTRLISQTKLLLQGSKQEKQKDESALLTQIQIFATRFKRSSKSYRKIINETLAKVLFPTGDNAIKIHAIVDYALQMYVIAEMTAFAWYNQNNGVSKLVYLNPKAGKKDKDSQRIWNSLFAQFGALFKQHKNFLTIDYLHPKTLKLVNPKTFEPIVQMQHQSPTPSPENSSRNSSRNSSEEQTTQSEQHSKDSSSDEEASPIIKPNNNTPPNLSKMLVISGSAFASKAKEKQSRFPISENKINNQYKKLLSLINDPAKNKSKALLWWALKCIKHEKIKLDEMIKDLEVSYRTLEHMHHRTFRKPAPTVLLQHFKRYQYPHSIRDYMTSLTRNGNSKQRYEYIQEAQKLLTFIKELTPEQIKTFSARIKEDQSQLLQELYKEPNDPKTGHKSNRTKGGEESEHNCVIL